MHTETYAQTRVTCPPVTKLTTKLTNTLKPHTDHNKTKTAMPAACDQAIYKLFAVSYTHLRAHET